MDIKKCHYSLVTYNLMRHITIKLMHTGNLSDPMAVNLWGRERKESGER